MSLPLPVPVPAPLPSPHSPAHAVRVGVGFVVGHVCHIAPPGCDRAGRPVRVFVLCPLRKATHHSRACEPYHVRVFVCGAPLCAEVDAIARHGACVRVRGDLYLRSRAGCVLQCRARAVEAVGPDDDATVLPLAPRRTGRGGPWPSPTRGASAFERHVEE